MNRWGLGAYENNLLVSFGVLLSIALSLVITLPIRTAGSPYGGQGLGITYRSPLSDNSVELSEIPPAEPVELTPSPTTSVIPAPATSQSQTTTPTTTSTANQAQKPKQDSKLTGLLNKLL